MPHISSVSVLSSAVWSIMVVSESRECMKESDVCSRSE